MAAEAETFEGIMKYCGISAVAAASMEEVLNYKKPKEAAVITVMDADEEIDEENTCKIQFETLNQDFRKMKAELTKLLEANTERCNVLKAELARSNDMVNLMTRTVFMLSQRVATSLGVTGGLAGQIQVPYSQPWLVGGQGAAAGMAGQIQGLVRISEDTTVLDDQDQWLTSGGGVDAGLVKGPEAPTVLDVQGRWLTSGGGVDAGLVKGPEASTVLDDQDQWLVSGGGVDAGLVKGSEASIELDDQDQWLASGGGVEAGLVKGPEASTELDDQDQWLARDGGGEAGMVKEPGVAQGMEALNNQVSTTDEVNMCRDWRSKEGCGRGSSCRWSHPTGKGRLAGRKECTFWLAGKCRYSKDHCNKGTHTEGKHGTKPRKTKPNKELQQKQVFLPAQANTQGQVMAGALTPELLQLLLGILQGGQAALRK